MVHTLQNVQKFIKLLIDLSVKSKAKKKYIEKQTENLFDYQPIPKPQSIKQNLMNRATTKFKNFSFH